MRTQTVLCMSICKRIKKTYLSRKTKFISLNVNVKNAENSGMHERVYTKSECA